MDEQGGAVEQCSKCGEEPRAGKSRRGLGCLAEEAKERRNERRNSDAAEDGASESNIPTPVALDSDAPIRIPTQDSDVPTSATALGESEEDADLTAEEWQIWIDELEAKLKAEQAARALDAQVFQEQIDDLKAMVVMHKNTVATLTARVGQLEEALVKGEKLAEEGAPVAASRSAKGGFRKGPRAEKPKPGQEPCPPYCTKLHEHISQSDEEEPGDSYQAFLQQRAASAAAEPCVRPCMKRHIHSWNSGHGGLVSDEPVPDVQVLAGEPE